MIPKSTFNKVFLAFLIFALITVNTFIVADQVPDSSGSPDNTSEKGVNSTKAPTQFTIRFAARRIGYPCEVCRKVRCSSDEIKNCKQLKCVIGERTCEQCGVAISEIRYGDTIRKCNFFIKFKFISLLTFGFPRLVSFCGTNIFVYPLIPNHYE
ncbi:hypothetical protein G9A89_000009 [Geosiphon pyriformis]|nr:hypothetical protein G9A89_000009 [Geosiphon pyriformis]